MFTITLNLFLSFSTILCFYGINETLADDLKNGIDLNGQQPAEEHHNDREEADQNRHFRFDLNEPPPVEEEEEDHSNNDAFSSSNNQSQNEMHNTSERTEPATSIITSDSFDPKKKNWGENDEDFVAGKIPRKQRSKRPRPIINVDQLNKSLELQMDLKDKFPKKTRSKRPTKKKENENDQKMVGEASGSSIEKRTVQQALADDTKQRKRRGVEEANVPKSDKKKEERRQNQTSSKEEDLSRFHYSPASSRSTRHQSQQLEKEKNLPKSRTTRLQSQKLVNEKKESPQFYDSPASSRTTRRRKILLDSLDVDNSTSSNSGNSGDEIQKETKAKTKIAIKEETKFYTVSKILAMYIYGNMRRLFFVDWDGYTEAESWILSEWMHTQEMVADFIENCSIMSVVHALAGDQEIPEHIAKELSKKEQFLKLMQDMGKDPSKMETSKFAFAEDITPRQKHKALAEIGDFLKSNGIQNE